MSKEINYETAAARLEEIVNALSQNDLPLDDALKLFEEGTGLIAFCTKKLDEAKQKITEIEKQEV